MIVEEIKKEIGYTEEVIRECKNCSFSTTFKKWSDEIHVGFGVSCRLVDNLIIFDVEPHGRCNKWSSREKKEAAHMREDDKAVDWFLHNDLKLDQGESLREDDKAVDWFLHNDLKLDQGESLRLGDLNIKY